MEEKLSKTQSDRLAQGLLAIKPDVTAGDRKALEDTHGFAKGTISIYLSGRVDDNDTAVKILTFLRERIAEREKVIS